MKKIAALLIIIISASHYAVADSETNKITIEVIKFDFTKFPDEFKSYSSDIQKSRPNDIPPILSSLKSSKIPATVIVKYSQNLNVGDHIVQSTTIANTQFDLDVVRLKDQSGYADLKLKLNLQSDKISSSIETKTLIQHQVPMIFPSFEQSDSSSSNIKSADFTIITIE